MAKIAVVVDSGLDIPAQLLEQHKIAQVPVLVHWRGKQYRDKVDLGLEELFDGIAAGEPFPTTSQPSPGEFIEVYEPLLDQMGDEGLILSFHLGSSFSGTYASACSAAAMMPAGSVEVIDTQSLSMGGGWQALAAAKTLQAGGSAVDAISIATEIKKNTGVKLILDTLDFVRRGGRISYLQGLLGSMLNIKPLLEVRDGKLSSGKKTRSRRQSLDMLLDEVVADCRTEDGRGMHLAVGHARAEEDRQWLMEQLTQRLPAARQLPFEVGVGIGTHGGPGVVGVCYYQQSGN